MTIETKRRFRTWAFSFTLQASPLGSMATRDVVARSIDQRCAESGASHVYLVTEHLDKAHLNERFPMISERLRKYGLELGIDPLPVAPAAHYIVGGIEVDEVGSALSGETREPIPGLFAIGGYCTGMHEQTDCSIASLKLFLHTDVHLI